MSALTYLIGALSYASQLKNEINSVASLLGLSPELIAGAIVEEEDSRERYGVIKSNLDQWLDDRMSNHTEQQIKDDYNAVIANNIINQKTGLIGKFNSVYYTTMDDVGPGNIRFAVAIKEMLSVANTPLGTQLGLDRYINNYLLLGIDLADPLGTIYPRSSELINPSTIVSIAGLHLKRDQEWLLEHVDLTYWNSLPKVTQDAIVLTIYNNGIEAIETGMNSKLSILQKYKPAPGAEESAGINHEWNATNISSRLGSTSDYGGKFSLLLSDLTPTQLREFASADNALGNAVRAALANFNPLVTVDINNQPVTQYPNFLLNTSVSQQWVNDRVNEYLAVNYYLAHNNSNFTISDPLGLPILGLEGDKIYEDVSNLVHTLTINGLDLGVVPSKHIVFGSNNNDTINSGNGSDRLYGENGSDNLNSHGGNDYLEGGDGDDTLDGGEDNDQLLGGQGADTYVFNAQFGNDTILDSDATDVIKIDGVTIISGTQLNPNLWKSADGAYRISVTPSMDGAPNTQTLIITKVDDLQNSITVKYWNDGDLGITLVKDATPEVPTNIDTANNGNNVIVNRSTVFGLGGNDYILATNDSDYIYGDGGNDLISTKDGSDIVDGGTGNDIIFGGLGRDVIFGGDGNDLIFSSATLNMQRTEIEQRIGNPTSGQTDLDQMYADVDYYFIPQYSTETQRFGYFMDFGSGLTTTVLPIIESGLTSQNQNYFFLNYYGFLNNGMGYAGEDVVYGGLGKDFILGSKDSDVLDGGDDDDNLFGLNGNDFLFGGNGKDEVNGGEGLDIIRGGDQDDKLFGGYDKDIIYGDGGNDYIQGDVENLYGTNAPPQSVDFSRFGDDELYGGAGNDTIIGNGGSDTIHGGDDDDEISGDAAGLAGQNHKTDTLYGDAGNDKVWGDGGADFIYGGEGNDQLSGDSSGLDGQYHGNDTIEGNDGDDKIWGQGGADTINGGAGNDQIMGDDLDLVIAFHGDDVIDGGVGDDTIWGQGGKDTIYGGDGDDVLAGDYATISGENHGDDIIYGDAGNDTIWGQGGKDTLYGGDGNDIINGDASGLEGIYHGKDTIEGGAGNDQIWGQGDDDIIRAGDGDDYVEGDDTALDGQYHGNDMIDGGAGNDNLWGNGGNDTIYGGAGNDFLQGDSQSDRQHDGNDKLYGGAGNDSLVGYDGNDTLDGGAGDDLLFAGNGNDTIISNEGNDQLVGGAGNDEYHIRVRDSEIKILDSVGDNHVYLEGAFDSSKISIKNYTNATSIIAPTSSDDPTALFPEFKLTFFDASTTQPTTSGGVLTDEYGNVVTGGYNHYLHFTDASNGAEQTIHVETYLKEKQGLSFHLWTGSWHGIQAPFLIYTNSQVNSNDQLVFDGSVIGDEIDISTIRTNTQNNGGSLADAYNLGGGDDIVQGSDVGDIIFGEGGDDIIHGLGGNNQLDGGDGNDVLDGNEGDDTIHAGNGNDVLDGGDGTNTLYGDAGNDTLKSGSGSDFLSGGIGNDVLDAGNGTNTLYGDAGNDTLKSGIGNDNISGGTGDDLILADSADDQLLGGHGNSYGWSNTGNYTLLSGVGGNDIINGGSGNDVLAGGRGNDTYSFSAGDGVDTIIDAFSYVNNNTEAAIFTAINGYDRPREEFAAALQEQAILTGKFNVIKFTDISSTQVSFSVTGDDLVITYGASDSILVKDFLDTQDNYGYKYSISQIEFQDGVKWSYEQIVERIPVVVITGTNSIDVIQGHEKVKNEIYGLDGDDIIDGGLKADLIHGGNGNDSITGGNSGGGDRLYGDAGDDNLSARYDGNTLDGGDGNDTLSVGSGNGNILIGGQGYDSYTFSGRNTEISDSDGRGLIYLNSEILYMPQTSPFSILDLPAGVLVSTDNDGTPHWKFSENSHRNAKFIYNATQGSLALNLNGEIPVNYIKFNGIYNQSNIDNLKSLDVQLSGKNIYYTSGELFRVYDSTKLSFSDLLNQGSVQSTYGSNDDVIYGLTNWAGWVGDTIYAGAGNDQINTGAGSSVVYGEDGNDFIVTPDVFAGDLIYAGAGDDTVYLYDPTLSTQSSYISDQVYGGDGNDRIYTGDELNATAYGESGNDYLQGSGQLYGGNGNDTLIAGDQGSLLDGGAGADILHGGLGDDTFIVDEFDTYTEDANSGYDTLVIAQSIDLQDNNFEALTLTGTGNFFGKGDEFNNQLIGNDGNNYLDGRAGSDSMEGGLGDDYYVVDVTDTVGTNEEGNSYILDGDQVIENANEGIDTIERWQDDRFIGQDINGNPVVTSNYRLLDNNIENLILKGNAKTGFGNDSDNIITGNAQNNYIDALGGDDTIVISRGGGTDTLSFDDLQSANDTLRLVGISENDLIAQRFSGQDSIYFSIRGTNDHFWLTNYYSAATDNGDGSYSDSKVDQIIFDSGVIWTDTDIQTLINRAASNHAPTVNQFPPTLIGSQDSQFSYTFAANTIVDQDVWDSVAYTVTLRTKNASGQYNQIPSWLTFDPATRTLSGTPTSANIGTLQFYLWGTDMYGLGAGAGVTLNITQPNHAPVIANAVPDQTFADGRLFSYTIASNSFTDPDGDAMTYQLTLADGSALPSWLTFNTSTRMLSGTAPDNTSTAITLKITARDIVGNTTSDLFDLKFTVQNLTINGTSGVDTLIGGSGNDTLMGLAGNDTLKGSSGNDTLDGGTGNDTLIGGTGNDLYIVDSATDVITENTNEGTDSVQSTATYTLAANVENLTLLNATAINGTGNALNNVLIGNSGVNTLTGGAGDDTLDGGAGNDTLIGGLGDDIYIVDSATDVITENTNEGTDSVQSTVNYTLAANVENLTLLTATAINGTGNASNNILIGNSAANTLNGGAGNDSLIGGLGDDIYVVDSATDVITENANEGTDSVQSSVTYTLAANVENLTLLNSSVINGTGNASNNILIGNSAVNTLTGGAGDDTLDGGAANDTLIGGIGNDLYMVDSATDVITENANEGTDSVQSTVTYTLAANVENLTLLTATALNGTGNALNNVLIGNSGVNTLTGGAGDDTLNGGAGNDTLIGGIGNDLYIVDSATDVITENANEGTDSVQSTVTYTLSANVENLTLNSTSLINGTGNALDNIIIGNSAANTLNGGAGNDSLIGGLGDDIYVVDSATDVITENANEGTDSVQSSVTYTLAANVENLTLLNTNAINGTGNALNNVLTGNSGVNTLNGGAGDDTLNGGAGNDILVGGTGNDLYIVDSTGDVITENANEGTDSVQSSVTYTLAANAENLTLLTTNALNGTGNALNNIIIGNSGVNTLTGGAGDDTLDGGAGNDTLIGGIGNDLYMVDSATDVITENANEGTDSVQSTVTYTLGANVENLTLLNSSAINGTGNASNNILIGNSAVNTLTGGAGDDTLDGGAGNDALKGGLGNDLYIVDSTGDVITENTSEGTDSVQSSVTYTLAANVENLTLTGSGVINATGNALANILIGNSAVNTLTGAAGNDTYNLSRSSSNDSIVENDTTAGNQDILQMTSDIRADQLWFRHVGTDLEVSVIGTSNSATIKNWYTANQYHVELFKSGDGKSLTDAKVQNLVNAMASMTPPAAGQTDLSASYQATLSPVLAANWT